MLCRRCRYFRSPLDEQQHLRDPFPRPCIRYFTNHVINIEPRPQEPENNQAMIGQVDETSPGPVFPIQYSNCLFQRNIPTTFNPSHLYCYRDNQVIHRFDCFDSALNNCLSGTLKQIGTKQAYCCMHQHSCVCSPSSDYGVVPYQFNGPCANDMTVIDIGHYGLPARWQWQDVNKQPEHCLEFHAD